MGPSYRAQKYQNLLLILLIMGYGKKNKKNALQMATFSLVLNQKPLVDDRTTGISVP